MKSKFLIILSSTIILFFSISNNIFSQLNGYVFEDLNNNEKKDKTEKGIANVSVSNQHNIALTNKEGFYQFDSLAHFGTISISMPMGYTGQYWKTINNTNTFINFPLTKTASKNSFSFIHASDTHIQPNNRHRVEHFRKMADSLGVDFIIVTGDLVKDALRVPEEKAASYFELYVSEMAKFSMPVWSVPGNHDIFGIERHKSLVSSKNPLYGKEMYHKYLGPNYYSFNYGGLHFIGIDAVNYEDLWYYGDVDPIQFTWLQNDLNNIPADMPVVTFNHIAFASPGFGLMAFNEKNLVSINGKKRYRHIVSNAAKVFVTLREHPYPLALAGHFHSAQSATFETGGNYTLFAQTSAITGPSTYYYAGLKVTSGFTLYEMEDGKIKSSKFIPLGL